VAGSYHNALTPVPSVQFEPFGRRRVGVVEPLDDEVGAFHAPDFAERLGQFWTMSASRILPPI